MATTKFKKPVIIVLDPALRTPEVECFNNLVCLSPVALQYHLVALGSAASFTQKKGNSVAVKGIIVLGSAASVHDNYPWQNILKNWLVTQFNAGVPALGICYGHQLFAHMHGARVGFVHADRRKLSGFRQVSFLASPLSKHKKMRGKLAVSHCETVLDCPKGWRVIASSPEIPIEILAHKSRPIWSIQAHPEAVPAFFRNPEMQKKNLSLANFAFGHALVKNFLTFCTKR